MLACVEVCEDQWCSYWHQMLQTACSCRGTFYWWCCEWWIIIKHTFFYFIKLMQYKDSSQQAFLIIYLICILSFIYFSLGRFRWVSHLKSRSAHKKVWAPLTKINGRSQQAFQNPKLFLKQTLLHLVLKLFRHCLVSPHSSQSALFTC